MTDQKQKMAELRGVGGARVSRLDWGARKCARGWVGRAFNLVSWSMGPSIRVINNMCTYKYIR
jgi:hypothetical protein